MEHLLMNQIDWNWNTRKCVCVSLLGSHARHLNSLVTSRLIVSVWWRFVLFLPRLALKTKLRVTALVY